MTEQVAMQPRPRWTAPRLVRLTSASAADLNFNSGWDIDGSWTGLGYPGYS